MLSKGYVFRGQGQDAFRDNKSDIVPCNPDLLEPVFYAAQRVGNELKTWIVKQAFLYTGNEAESRTLADLAKFP